MDIKPRLEGQWLKRRNVTPIAKSGRSLETRIGQTETAKAERKRRKREYDESRVRESEQIRILTELIFGLEK